MLGVIEFAGATGVFPEDVVDVFEGLFKHGRLGGRKVAGIPEALLQRGLVGVFFGWGDPDHGVGADSISKGFVREQK